MITQGIVVLALLFLLLPAPAPAQPGTWIAGPLVNAVAGANGPIDASILWDRDGEGSEPDWLVVGGNFTSIAGVAANRIAARNPYTGQWQPLGNGVSTTNGGVYCLTVYHGDLIVGGFFSPDTPTGLNVARWDGSAWHAMGAGFGGGVMALSVYNDEVVAGGYLGLTGGTPIEGAARWNGTSWIQLGSGPGFVVWSLGFYNGELIAGGDCNGESGSEYQPGIKAWNGSSWRTLGSGMGPIGKRVTSLTLYNGELIAGGSFTDAGGVAANKVARWNGSSWQSMGTIASGDHDLVVAFANQSGLLYGGVLVFVSAGVWDGQLSRWNGSSWTSVGSTDADLNCLSVLDGDVIVGGAFVAAGGQVANGLARWTGTDWGPFDGGTVSEVDCFASYHTRFVAGGLFQQPSPGYPIYDVVGWDGLTLKPFGSGMNGTVYALESSDASSPYELIAAGSFFQAGGVTATRIARWFERDVGFPPPAWEAMGAGFNNAVYAVEHYNGQIYAGGAFSATGATSIGRIARWNEATHTWQPLGSGMNGTVYALKAYGGYLYAGGSFTGAGGVLTGGLARWNGSSWSTVDGINFVGTVYALEVYLGLLEVGGSFSWFSGSPNAITYIPNVGFSSFGGTNGAVRALASINGALFLAGDFTTVGGSTAAARVAYYDTGWHPAGSGTNASVRALAGFHGEANAGGTFTAVSGAAMTSPGWGRFTESGVPWLASQPASRSVTSGAEITFTSRPALGYSGATLQWFHNDQPLANGPTGHGLVAGKPIGAEAVATGSTISGANEATLTITNAAIEDAGSYRLVVSNAYGGANSNTVTLTVDGITATPTSAAPSSHVFEALGPNPTRGAVGLAFGLARDADVRATVHDVAGRRVRVIDLGRLPAGRQRTSWDGRDDGGSAVRAGLFFVTLEVDGRRVGTRRIVVQR